MEETDRRTKNRQTVRSWRFNHRQELDEKRERENFERSPEGKLVRHQQQNFEKLTPEEQQTIEAVHHRTNDALLQIVEVIHVLSGGQPTDATVPLAPDAIYRDCAALPKCECMQVVEVAAYLSAEDFEAFIDDENFRRFGRLSKIPIVLSSELARLVLEWAKNNPGQCDPTVQRELEATVKSNFPPLIPATKKPAGIRQPTTAEERAIHNHKQHVATARQLADRQRRSPYV